MDNLKFDNLKMENKQKKIVFTVINDLSCDRRMDRIASSLVKNGYEVTLVGRELEHSLALESKLYKQKRLKCWVNKGVLFYAEYNIRLFFYLLFSNYEIYGAIDLDTILPNKIIAQLTQKIWVYDAHEYFTEVIEIQDKKFVKGFWQWVEKISLNKNVKAYTVSQSYADLFKESSGANFEIIRNCPPLVENENVQKHERFTFIYVGAVNAGRGLEECISAINGLDAQLLVCGDGDVLEALKNDLSIEQKNQVIFTGYMKPESLEKEILKAHVGLLLLRAESKSYVYSLANKFFDYVHAEIPQVVIDFPEYIKMNQQIEVAAICSISVEEIRAKMLLFLKDEAYYSKLKENTIQAKQVWNWEAEEEKLIKFYQNL